jgi:hypothetical protein
VVGFRQGQWREGSGKAKVIQDVIWDIISKKHKCDGTEEMDHDHLTRGL